MYWIDYKMEKGHININYANSGRISEVFPFEVASTAIQVSGGSSSSSSSSSSSNGSGSSSSHRWLDYSRIAHIPQYSNSSPPFSSSSYHHHYYYYYYYYYHHQERFRDLLSSVPEELANPVDAKNAMFSIQPEQRSPFLFMVIQVLLLLLLKLVLANDTNSGRTRLISFHRR